MYLKQCILIFKLLLLCLCLSSCMDSVYTRISNLIDEHYSIKRVERFCSTSLMNIFQVWHAADEANLIKNSFTTMQNDKKINEIRMEYIRNLNSDKNNLENFDRYTEKLKKLHPNYFKDCALHSTRKCEQKSKKLQISCHESQVRKFYIEYLKASWLFKILDNETKESIVKLN